MTDALMGALMARATEQGEDLLSFGRVGYGGPFDRAFAAESAIREPATAALLGVTHTYILVARAKQPDTVLGTRFEFIYEAEMGDAGNTMTIVTRGQPMTHALGPSGETCEQVPDLDSENE
jgi:hypothetical protein